MIEIVRTSDVASHAYAGRIVRETSKHNMAVMRDIEEAISPVWEEIATRGKLPRAKLLPAFNSILRGLEGTKNLVDVRLGIMRPSALGLSANDHCNARLVVAMALPEGREVEQRFDFLALDLTVRRSFVELRMDVINFNATSHVLARFIRRGGGDLRAFFGDILRPMRAASMLAPSATFYPSCRLMLPHGTGFLLAEAEIHDDPDDETRKIPCVIRYDATGRHVETVESANHTPGARVIARAWSFIDGDGANERKSAAYTALLDWEQMHAEGISLWFDAYSFGSAPVKTYGDQPRLMEAVGAAGQAAKSLVESEAWRAFAEGRDDE